MKRIDSVALARLEQLANGAEAANDRDGICWSLRVAFRDADIYQNGTEYCQPIFESLGLHKDYPLGHFENGDDPDLWVREYRVHALPRSAFRGWFMNRRELCKHMAAWIREYRA